MKVAFSNTWDQIQIPRKFFRVYSQKIEIGTLEFTCVATHNSNNRDYKEHVICPVSLYYFLSLSVRIWFCDTGASNLTHVRVRSMHYRNGTGRH